MAEEKKITLHPLKADGTINTDINLYPKTNNIIDNEGKSIDVVSKEQILNLRRYLDEEISRVEALAEGKVKSFAISASMHEPDAADFEDISSKEFYTEDNIRLETYEEFLAYTNNCQFANGFLAFNSDLIIDGQGTGGIDCTVHVPAMTSVTEIDYAPAYDDFSFCEQKHFVTNPYIIETFGCRSVRDEESGVVTSVTTIYKYRIIKNLYEKVKSGDIINTIETEYADRWIMKFEEDDNYTLILYAISADPDLYISKLHRGTQTVNSSLQFIQLIDNTGEESIEDPRRTLISSYEITAEDRTEDTNEYSSLTPSGLHITNANLHEGLGVECNTIDVYTHDSQGHNITNHFKFPVLENGSTGTLAVGEAPTPTGGGSSSLSLVGNATTNFNGLWIGSGGGTFYRYGAEQRTIMGYQCWVITYDNNSLAPAESRYLVERYMKYMSGSEFVPEYNYQYPQTVLFMFTTGTMAGSIWKPQWDSTYGLVLWKVSDGYIDLNNPQTITGQKTFTNIITNSISDGTNTVSIADLAALITYAKGQGWIS